MLWKSTETKEYMQEMNINAQLVLLVYKYKMHCLYELSA